MLVPPDTTIRLANSEQMTLALNVDEAPSSVRLVPRFGEEQVLALDAGAFAFPPMDTPNTARIEWLDSEGETAHVSFAEVVSSHYFRLDDLRAYGDGQDDFENMDEETLFMARQAATEVFEQNARRSFVHRTGKTRDYGKRHMFYLRDNDVYEVLTEGYRLVSDCQCEYDWASQQEYPVEVEYLYGCDSIPAQVSRAVLVLAAYMLRPTNRPIGATGESTDAGYIRFTTAGIDGATDVPEVNAAIEQFGRGVRYLW